MKTLAVVAIFTLSLLGSGVAKADCWSDTLSFTDQTLSDYCNDMDNLTCVNGVCT